MPPESLNEPPLPENWPASLDEFLRRHVAVANLCRTKQFERLHGFELHRLRKRFPGATASDAARLVYQRQKSGITDLNEWNDYVEAYRSWWGQQSNANVRGHQFKKVVDKSAVTSG